MEHTDTGEADRLNAVRAHGAFPENWLKRHECEPEEADPLGIILCAGQRAQHVELLELHKSGIHVASYWTKVLPKKLLERKLHDAVRLARARLAAGKD